MNIYTIQHVILKPSLPLSLYTAGFVSIDSLQFSLNSALSADPPVFTLTCVSTGGPATTVTWIRDGVAATGVTSQTVVDQLAITYNNTLIVTGREPGNYQCSISNDRTAQPATASLTVAGEALYMISLLREFIIISALYQLKCKQSVAIQQLILVACNLNLNFWSYLIHYSCSKHTH